MACHLVQCSVVQKLDSVIQHINHYNDFFRGGALSAISTTAPSLMLIKANTFKVEASLISSLTTYTLFTQM